MTTFLQRIRDGKLFKRGQSSRCWFSHRWEVRQHNVNASENVRHVFVIAWRQCRRCGKSELIHILE